MAVSNCSNPFRDDIMTPNSSLTALTVPTRQDAGGDHPGSRAVVLVEDVQAILVVIVAGVVVVRDLTSGLAEQSFFLDALLLALSGLAAASVVASFFIGGHDAQLVGEAALVAGVAGGAANVSVYIRNKGKEQILHNHEEEHDVEGEKEQEHDESFEGEKSVEVHVC